jgi:hypothetical protein
MRTLSRLDMTLFRLQSQKACLTCLFDEIRGMPGVVVELGLGHGRTFDHLRRHLPDREIFVFDRSNDAYVDCQPDASFLFLGEIEQTLPALNDRLSGRTILANSDIGCFDQELNRKSAAMMSQLLAPMMAPGGFIMSDLQLEIADYDTLTLPDGALDGRYFLYRRPLSSDSGAHEVSGRLQ